MDRVTLDTLKVGIATFSTLMLLFAGFPLIVSGYQLKSKTKTVHPENKMDFTLEMAYKNYRTYVESEYHEAYRTDSNFWCSFGDNSGSSWVYQGPEYVKAKGYYYVYCWFSTSSGSFYITAYPTNY